MSLPNPLGSTLRVPSASVVAAPNGHNYVWIVERTGDRTGKVVRRTVKPDGLAPNHMIGITEGLEEGDVVVTRGVHQLDANMEVALQPRMIQFSLAPAYQPSPTPGERNRRTVSGSAFQSRALSKQVVGKALICPSTAAWRASSASRRS